MISPDFQKIDSRKIELLYIITSHEGRFCDYSRLKDYSRRFDAKYLWKFYRHRERWDKWHSSQQAEKGVIL